MGEAKNSFICLIKQHDEETKNQVLKSCD